MQLLVRHMVIRCAGMFNKSVTSVGNHSTIGRWTVSRTLFSFTKAASPVYARIFANADKSSSIIATLQNQLISFYEFYLAAAEVDVHWHMAHRTHTHTPTPRKAQKHVAVLPLTCPKFSRNLLFVFDFRPIRSENVMDVYRSLSTFAGLFDNSPCE